MMATLYAVFGERPEITVPFVTLATLLTRVTPSDARYTFAV
jgi:hypothetical protein